MPSYCTNSNGMSLLASNAMIEPHAILIPPGGILAAAGDRCGSFDEGPLQILIRLFDHLAKAKLATAALDLWCCASVAGEITRGGKAIDITNLEINDDGQNLAYAWQGLQQLHACG